MLQIDFLQDILIKCRENNIHTAVDTAGNVPWNYFAKIMPYTDLFVYDVKCISETLHIEGTGISNKLILDNLRTLSKHFNGDIIVRIPIVTGFNDNIEEMQKNSHFLKSVHYKNVELLPYHKMGEHKYAALNMELTTFSTPETKCIEIYKKLFIK